VPPHVILVQGASPQDTSHQRTLSGLMPKNFGDGAPVTIQSGPGPVTVMVKPIPFEQAAHLEEQGIAFQIPPLKNA